jgi:hypothetical protein
MNSKVIGLRFIGPSARRPGCVASRPQDFLVNTNTRNRSAGKRRLSAKHAPPPGKAAPARSGSRRTAGGSATPSRAAKADDPPTAAATRRKFYVFLSLGALLSGTSVLLLALAPAPLKPDSTASLFAIDNPGSMDVIFETTNPVADGRWKYIYVHHSQTASGNAATLGARPGGLADHFVIGNGSGCVDGEIQVGHRWATQLAAGNTTPTASVRPDCISICVVGDFNRTAPTPTQRLRLSQLVATLQSRLGISGGAVHLIQGSGTAADAGRLFPVEAFRQQLLP